MDTAQTGQIDIYRPHRYFAILRSYSIWIDGKKTNRIKDRERIFIPVTQGVHNIFVKIDYIRSNSMDIKIAAGQTVKLLVWYRHVSRSIALKALYIALIAIGLAGVPLVSLIGVFLLLLHRTGKLQIYEIEA